MPTQQADAKVTKVSGKAYAERNGTRIVLSEGSDIFASDSISTDGKGAVELVFRDDSIIKLGPSSHVAVQDFVFDGESNPSFAVHLASGVMGYISGKVVEQNPAAFKINTPRATVGIRGTETYHSVSGESETHAVVYISAGHIVLLTSSDGRAITLGSAMQAVTLHEGNAEPLTIRSFESNEMDKLQNALRDMRAPQEGEVQEQEPQNQDLPSEESVQQPIINTTASAVVQDEIRVVVVAEEGNATLTELVQGALASLPGTTVDTLLPSSEVIQTLAETTQTQPYILPDVAPFHPGASDTIAQPEPPVMPEEPVIPEEPVVPEEPVIPHGNEYIRAELTETLIGGIGNDTFTIGTMKGNGRIEASYGDDVMRIGASMLADGTTPFVDGGAGVDTLELGSLSSDGNSIDVIRVEHIYGGSRSDSITLLDDVFAGQVKAGAGDDLVTVQGVLSGGSIDLGEGDDKIIIAISQAGASVDGGAGDDTLQLGDQQNVLSVTNVETIYGGSQGDTITLRDAAFAGQVETGAGNDVVTVQGVLTGGTIDLGVGNDTVILGGPQLGGTINLGDGDDSIHIDRLSATASFSIDGGAGKDTINIVSWENGAKMRVKLALGEDVLQVLKGTPNDGGPSENGSSWTQVYINSAGDGARLSIIFEGISTRDEYNALVLQSIISL